MASVYEEIQKRAEVVQRAHPDWSQVDCETDVLHDPELYRRYVQESSRPPEPSAPTLRLSAEPMGAQAEVMKRTDALIAKSAGRSYADALAEVFRADPGLYVAYTKQDSRPAPTFGAELLGYEMDLYGYYQALSSTLQGILASDAGDKGAKIATALDDFKGAVLAQVRQAGLSVPTEKRASEPAQFIPTDVQTEILKTAGHLCHGNYVQGMAYLKNTLREIRGVG